MFCILVLPVQDHFEEVDTLLQIVSLIAYSSDPHFITTNVPPIVSIDKPDYYYLCCKCLLFHISKRHPTSESLGSYISRDEALVCICVCL